MVSTSGTGPTDRSKVANWSTPIPVPSWAVKVTLVTASSRVTSPTVTGAGKVVRSLVTSHPGVSLPRTDANGVSDGRSMVIDVVVAVSLSFGTRKVSTV